MHAATAPPLSDAAASTACLHCGQSVPSASEGFCCVGCEAVYGLLHAEGLGRYYELGSGLSQASASSGADHKWIDALPVRTGWLTIDAQGIHCAACVWLFEKLFARHQDALAIEVNPALGTLRIASGPRFDLAGFVADVERFGYRLGPANKANSVPRRDPLVLRMGLCIALAMNAMIFAVAFYAGLDQGVLFRQFHSIELGLGVLSVLIGGSYFIRSAWLGLRHGVLHLDLPIALGVVLAFVSSSVAYLADRTTTYFDTLTVFIALMLVGRWLQERVLQRNRRELLSHDGAEGMLTRRVRDARVELVPCVQIELHDRLLIAPGDLLPVDAVLDEAEASCSLDWINGESAPRTFARGETVLAGAFNAGDRAFVCIATQTFADSTVLSLVQGGGFSREPSQRWQRFVRLYVLLVLAAAALGFFAWWLWAGDLPRALEVTAGTLIITCPCAFGIATPLGYEIVQARLRRAGLFAQNRELLDRAREVRHIVFDKTGTLTTGHLELADPAALAQLSPAESHALYNLTSRSAHPKSAALARALAEREVFEPLIEVVERAGHGLRAQVRGVDYRLESDGEQLALWVDGAPRARFALRERLREDAVHEIRQLRAAGYHVWIASGDTKERALRVAETVGVPADRVRFACSPRDKAALVAQLGRALMVGDGINDGPAAERAFCSGTPAIDRPFLPARTDFYFTTAGLAPIAHMLRSAHRLGWTARRNLGIAVTYNLLGISLAWAGLLSPLVCAVLMPLSSVSVVLATVWSLAPSRSLGSPPWKS